MKTSEIVYDQFDDRFPIEVSGNGRIDASKAINAELIIMPPNLIFDLSPANQIQTKHLKINGIDGESMSIRFEESHIVDFDYDLEDENLVINAKLTEQSLGEFESRIIINHNEIDYHIPIIVRVSEGAMTINEDGGKLGIDISSPTSWSYAKISIINQETGKTFTDSIVPGKNSELTVYQPGEYWIEAEIDRTLSAYATIQVKKIGDDEKNLANTLNLPEKPILIIAAIMIVTAIVGLSIRRR